MVADVGGASTAMVAIQDEVPAQKRKTYYEKHGFILCMV